MSDPSMSTKYGFSIYYSSETYGTGEYHVRWKSSKRVTQQDHVLR